jgi:hypothetical protein
MDPTLVLFDRNGHIKANTTSYGPLIELIQEKKLKPIAPISDTKATFK